MKIGYTIDKADITHFKEMDVTSVVLMHDSTSGSHQFIEFLKINPHNDVYLVEIQSISRYLSMLQLYSILECVIEQKRLLYFLDKGAASALSDKEYLAILWQLASCEKEAISNRVRQGMERSKERGTPRGRPTIEPKVIEKIRRLKYNEKKSIREIASLCNVSVGSVHKYVQAERELKD